MTASGSAPPTRAGEGAGVALAIAGAIAFSGKAIVVKLAYRHPVDGVTLIMLRMVVALPFFVAMAWWGGRGRPALDARDRRAVAGLGFCGYYLASTLDFVGLQFITAGLERLILYLTPAIVTLLSWLLHGRRAGARQVLALALGYAGLAIVLVHEWRPGGDGARTALGAGLVLASTLSYAAYLIGSGEVVGRLGAWRFTGWASGVAAGLCVAQFALLRPVAATLAALPAPVWGWSLVNGTLCTVVPVLAVAMAIERLGAARVAQLGMAGPIATIAMGVVWLGEPFGPWHAAGTACVLVAVALLARRPRSA